MLFLGVAQSTAEQIGQPSLPVILPEVLRQDLDGGGSQAVEPNGPYHPEPLGIVAVERTVTEIVLPAGPAELGCGATESIKDDAIGLDSFLEKPVD